MFIFGVIFALIAGILFGLIGPTTKIAYNAGASVGLAIFLRYAVASIIILPFIPYQKNLLSNFKKNINLFLLISVGSIFLTLGLLTSVIFIEVSLTILIFCLYPIYVLLYSIIIDKEKIYLTVKPSGYRQITVPNLIQITKRNAESMINSVGFQLGEITYKDNIGKDMVLEIAHKGKSITPGVLLPKTSKIDLVLGNGKR